MHVMREIAWSKSEPFNKKIAQRLFKKCKAAINLSEPSDSILLSATDTPPTPGVGRYLIAIQLFTFNYRHLRKKSTITLTMTITFPLADNTESICVTDISCQLMKLITRIVQVATRLLPPG